MWLALCFRGSLQARRGLLSTTFSNGLCWWRNFVGVSVPIAKGLTVEPGYLNQAVFRPGEDRYDHIASMTMFYRF